MTTSSPPLACVVLSVDCSGEVLDAVDSLLSQSVVPEIVLVNSGTGDPFKRFESLGEEVRIIHHGGRLTPGAARNLGIAASSAPIVSFLASDCLAEPDWVRLRLEAHRDHEAVSSAVCNADPNNPVAVAAFMTLFPRRMPGTPDKFWLHYGVSYARSLFDRFGTFREDMRSGEDTEFHQRFAGEVRIHRGRGVVTRHRHATRLRPFLRNHFGRGERAGRAFANVGQHEMARRLPSLACRRLPDSFGLYWRGSGLRDRLLGLLALPAALAGTVAYARGARAFLRRPQDDDDLGETPPLTALLQVRNGMRYLPGYLDNLAGKVSGVIVLDDGSIDGSREFASRSPLVRRLIANPLREDGPWSERDNRQRLVEAAREEGAGWVIALDVDERLPEDFPARLRHTLARAGREHIGAFALWLRELWDDPLSYRVDGIWGGKWVARLFDVGAGTRHDRRELHGHWAPVDAQRHGVFVPSDLEIYHLSMVHPADRLERCQKYERLDPEHRWQPIGYRYLVDETGCVRRTLAGSQRYHPPARPAEIDPAPPRLIALLVFHNEARFLPGYLDNVAPQVDGIVALDDGSTDGSAAILRGHPKVLEILANPVCKPHAWDEPFNQRRLIEAVAGHAPQWLVVVDADERLEQHFRARANGIIRQAEHEGVLALSIAIRELWDHPYRYRADGPWGRKRKASLFRYREDHEFDPRPMHNYWAPLNSRINGQFRHADLQLYHLRMLRAEDRQQRQARYMHMDPDNRWQSAGYDYLCDETGLELAEVDPERTYLEAACEPPLEAAGEARSNVVALSRHGA